MRKVLFALALLLVPINFALASDEAIVNSITSQVSQEIPASHYQLKVDARHGHVTLSGDVISEGDINKIKDIARNTTGVLSVKDRLALHMGLAAGKDAESQELCVRVKDNIKGRNQSLNIECALGNVTITGTVADDQARARVEKAAWDTPGVKNVKTEIGFPRPLSDAEITAAVQRALDREGMNVNSVNFASKDGIVRFSGTVPNHRVIDAMLATTLMVDGVRDVQSTVAITR